MSLNGKRCWNKRNFIDFMGTSLCGGLAFEQVFRISECQVTLSARSEAVVPLTVRVWTNLDEDATDESFGIDNVVISRFQKIQSTFDTAFNAEGWKCGKIVRCGDYQFCGGDKVKGKGGYIKRTIRLPPGTYSVELDFIKIDFWFVCVCVCVCVNDMLHAGC